MEDLAIVQYMFCDKTGTLTKNQLKFREIKLIERDESEPIILKNNRLSENIDDENQAQRIN